MRHRKKQLNQRTALLLVLVSVALSGCLKPPPPGVSVRAVTADLVFGVPPIPEPVLPPAFEESAPAPSQGASPRPRQSNIPTPPSNPCPKASEQTFPEEEATTFVKGRPEYGIYPWKWQIDAIPSGGTTQTVSDGMVIKGVTEVRELDSTAFNFGEGEFAFYVNSNKTFLSVQTYEIVQNNPPKPQEDGIFLTDIYRKNLQSGEESFFHPEPKVKVLPLPVKIDGEEFTSAGVDSSLAVLRITGTIEGRRRVDVCGKVIDSWFVNGSQEFVAPGPDGGTTYQLDYDYAIATQFGGRIVFEDIKEDSAQARIIQYKTLGSLTPAFPIDIRTFFS